jgi:hypothetical protein
LPTNFRRNFTSYDDGPLHGPFLSSRKVRQEAGVARTVPQLKQALENEGWLLAESEKQHD